MKNKNLIFKLLFVLGIATFSSLISILLYHQYFQKQNENVLIQENPTNTFTHLVSNGGTFKQLPDFSFVAEHAVNAVVHVKIYMENQYKHSFFDNFFFYNPPIEQPDEFFVSSGSGVIVSSDGYIVTNNHVIKNAGRIEVVLNNRKSYDAELVGYDKKSDLAILKIEEDNLEYLTYGNSSKIKVGEWALAIGNPFNLKSTVTAGIISAKGRNMDVISDYRYRQRSLESFIQTDAAVNPGNSGGALINTAGELIGINTAIKSNTGSYVGFAFAIPSNVVKKVVNDIIEFGFVQKGYLGIAIRNIDEMLAENKDIEDLQGVYISEVFQDRAAYKAGIRKGDIIRAINNTKLKNTTDLNEELSQYRPLDKIKVGVERNGKLKEINVTLQNQDGENNLATKLSMIESKIGLKLKNIDKQELSELGIEYGVKVEKVLASSLKKIGIKSGFVIVKFNKRPVRSAKALRVYLSSSRRSGVLLEGFYKKGERKFYGFGIFN